MKKCHYAGMVTTASMTWRTDAAVHGDGAADAPLTSLLRVLRASLESKVSHDASHTACPHPSLNSCARDAVYHPSGGIKQSVRGDSTNDLLASIVAGDPDLQESVQSQIHGSMKSARLDTARRRRRELRVLRIARAKERDRKKRLIERECESVGKQAERQRAFFERYVEQQYYATMQRLQALFYECAAEMKKAVVRMDAVSADEVEEAASMMDARDRRLHWQLFLSRLEEDFRSSGVLGSVLHPLVESDASNLSGSRDVPPTALCSALDAVMRSHGPSIPAHQSLKVQSVLAIKRSSRSFTQLSLDKSKCPQPSLLFGNSSAEAWSGVACDLQQYYHEQLAAVKPALSSARSTRRIRRLPVSVSQHSASPPRAFQVPQQGTQSHARRLISMETPQFAGIESDVPLSSSFLRWLTDSPSQTPQRRSHANLLDCNIYFDLTEYHHKFPSSVQSLDTGKLSDATSDKGVLSSVRSAISDVNDILDSYRETLDMGRSLRDLAVSFPGKALLGHFEERHKGEDDGRERVFVRASVLQLVQTTYFSTHFAPQFPPQDRLSLQQMYPSSLMGSGFLSDLYIPLSGSSEPDDRGGSLVGTTTQSPDQDSVFMSALSDEALHELLLVYIARARRSSEKTVAPDSTEASDSLESMARSDAIQALLPSVPESIDTSRIQVCVIRNPYALLQPFERKQQAGGPTHNTLLHDAADADYLYIELRITDKVATSPPEVSRAQLSARRLVVEQSYELLGSSCQWRSCLDPVNVPSNASMQLIRVCSWHNVLKTFLSDKEGCQYLPILSDIRTSSSDTALTRVKSARRTIAQSSSLLQELTSRQLCHSLRAFFDHVRTSLTSSTFLKTQCAIDCSALPSPAPTSLTESNTNAEEAFQALQDMLDQTRTILQTERRATLALHCLRKLVSQNRPNAALSPNNVLDIVELHRDIRTMDQALVLQLCGQKLQRLEQLCRAEEEARDSALQSVKSNDERILESFAPINTSGAVFDVVHVLRKGRRSLQRQQQAQQQQSSQPPRARRPQSATRRSHATKSTWKSLQRVASDFEGRGADRDWSDVSGTTKERSEDDHLERRRDRRQRRVAAR